MSNEKNLIPFNKRTESEQREIAQQGGIASGKARRRKRSMKEAADYYLSLPETDRRRVNALLRDEVDPEDVDNQMSVVMGMAEAAKRGIVQDILLEVNIGGEEAKSGFAPESLEQAAEEAKKCANVRVRGLMCIPPVAEGEHGSLPYFEKVHALFVDINAKLYDNTLDILSMGMSGDYEDAVRAGATMVRVGTAIFGARNYTI